MPKKLNLLGQRFGRLVVIAKDDKLTKEKKRTYWICQCDCGKIKTIKGASLTYGEVKSCGCLQKELASKIGKKNIKNLLGQRFNKLVVIKQVESQNNRAHWLCRCDCGQTKVVSSTNLIEKKVQSCGCINYSLGEQNIEKCLKNNNIKYIKQYTFQDLPKRYFDFAILDKNNNLIKLIEFDGPQHYDKKYNWYSDEQVKRDQEKNEYCKKNNIELIRIPYSYRDNISLELLKI